MDLKKNNFLIIITLIISYLVLYGEDFSMQTDIIALVVAIIGVIGAILANFFQYKKDSNTIGTVKQDTALILPKAENIERDTRETHNLLIGKLDAEIDKLITGKDKIDFIFDEINYKKRLESEYKGVVEKDRVVASVDKIFEDNANLQIKLKELEIENKMLMEKAYKYQKLYEEEREKNIDIESKNERDFTL
ncbi:hypothetical protein ACQQ97_05215 [Anaerovoracaceae bacterium SGI.195]